MQIDFEIFAFVYCSLTIKFAISSVFSHLNEPVLFFIIPFDKIEDFS